MVTKDDLARVLLIAQAIPVAKALEALLDFDKEAGHVIPEHALVKLETALWYLEEFEEHMGLDAPADPE